MRGRLNQMDFLTAIRRRAVLAGGAALACLSLSGAAQSPSSQSTTGTAQAVPAWPTRPVRIVVPYSAGSVTDVMARVLAQKFSTAFGQQFVVENRAGANGNLGGAHVAASAADGHTIMFSTTGPLSLNKLIYKSTTFDPLKDFTPIILFAEVPLMVSAHPSVPAKNIQELVAYVKANPGKVNYASQGIGTTSHLSGALFETVTGTKLVHVPYKGTGPALNDIIASHVDIIFMEMASAIKLHEAGRARILGVATTKRIPALPDIPTLDEAGVKGFESGTWNAIAAPPKTPDAIVQKLNKAIVEVLNSPEAQEHFAKLSLRAGGGTPAETKAFIKHETEVWGGVIKAAGVPAN